MNKQTQLSIRAYYYWAVGIILFSTLLRIVAAGGDLWLDEIWQLQTVHVFHSIWDQFDLKISAAQPSAYTSLLYLIGRDEPSLMRLPSFLFGALSVLLMAWLTFPRGKLLSLISTFLFGICYPMVLYGSEARGYSAMIFFGLLAWLTIDRGIQNHKPNLAPIFWASSFLGVLFQPVSLQFYAGFLCWSTVRAYRSTEPGGFKNVLWWHGPALLCIAAYYSLFLRHISPLNGLISSRLEVMLNTASFLLGGPQLTACSPNIGLIALSVALVALCIIGTSILRLFRNRDDRWSFYAVVIFVAPIAIVLINNPASFSVRYLLPSIVASIPLLAGFLINQKEGTKISQGLMFIALAAITLGNSVYLKQLLVNGRAQYRQALEYIISHSDQFPTTLASANDFRAEMILGYYNDRISRPGVINYQTKTSASQPTVWYLAHGYDRYCAPAQQLDKGGISYNFEKLFDFSTLSGWQWYLYKKVTP